MKKPLSVKTLHLSLKIAPLINIFLGKLFRNNYDIILCYHDVCNDDWEFSVSNEQFELHIRELRKHVDIVSLCELLDQDVISRKPRAAITFDDGYDGVYNNAFPILTKYEIPATVFIIGNNTINPKGSHKSNLLNKSQIKKLADAGWEIGFHTTSHNNLSKLGEHELIKEISQGKDELEKDLGIKFKYFAYPSGMYNKDIKRVSQEAGFDAAFTVCGNKISKRKDKRYEINRITISKYISQEYLKTLITPIGILINKVFTYTCRIKDDIWGHLYD